MDKEPQVIDAEVVTENKELVTINGHSPEALAVTPVMDIEQAVKRYEQMGEFVSRIMKKDVDFGTIPGTSKDTLLKPGAEKLTTFFGLTPRFVDERVVEDDSDPENTFYFYRRKCQLYRGDRMVGEASGSCNSREAKYRWRNAKRSCPECGEELRISKSDNKEWYCWAKTGGCGSTFPADDKRITGQEVGKIENENIADLANTILKMADKRALVAATLIVCNASEFFTQDLEDMATNGATKDEPENKPVKPVKAPPKVHWTKDDELLQSFDTYYKGKTLEMVNVIDALNDSVDYEVTKIEHYKGDRDEAKVALEAWIDKQVNGSKSDSQPKYVIDVKSLLRQNAEKLEGDGSFKIANLKDKEKFCAALLTQILQKSDNKRRRLMAWLYDGETSLTKVSPAQLQALWLYLGSPERFDAGVEPRISARINATYEVAIGIGLEEQDEEVTA